MNDENTEYLLKAYPTLYEEIYGFACGDGWFKLIEELSAELYNESQRSGCSCAICDVKEKYGTLRVYTDSSNDKIDKLIDKAEADSAKICEICGAPGRIRGSVWFSTYCDDCAEK
jgi:hypothetical protein